MGKQHKIDTADLLWSCDPCGASNKHLIADALIEADYYPNVGRWEVLIMLGSLAMENEARA